MGKKKGKREPAAALVPVDDQRHFFTSAEPSVELTDRLGGSAAYTSSSLRQASPSRPLHRNLVDVQENH